MLFIYVVGQYLALRQVRASSVKAKRPAAAPGVAPKLYSLKVRQPGGGVWA
jgi:hypothetical protein